MDVETLPESILFDTDEQSATETALQGLLAELSADSDASVNVYRQPGHGKRQMAYLFSCAPSEYQLGSLLDKIRDEYGGGDYRIHVRKNDRLIANRPISIDAPRKPVGVPDVPMSALPPVAPSTDLLGGLERLMLAQELRFERMLGALRPASQADPMEIVTKLLGSIVSLKDLFIQPAAAAAATKPNEVLDTVKTFIEVQQLLGRSNNEAGPMDVVMQALNHFGPTIAKAAETGVEAQQVIATGQANMEKLASIAAQDTAVKPPSKPIEVKKPVTNPTPTASPFAGHIRQLCRIASLGGEPQTWANAVLDFTPAEHHPELVEFLQREDCLAQMEEIDPHVRTHSDWFAELRELILEQFKPEFEGVEDAGAIAPMSHNGAPHPLGEGTAHAPEPIAAQSTVADTSGTRGDTPDAGAHAGPGKASKKKSGHTSTG